MGIKQIIKWNYFFKGKQYNKHKVTFTKAMLIDFISIDWYEFFFDEKGKLRYSDDYIIATAREVGKSYVAIAIFIYIAINDPLSNFVLTRKYGTAAGAFKEMFSQVLNDFQDKYQIDFNIEWSQEYKKGKFRTLKQITQLKGSGVNNLFSYGKTNDDKQAIFYNINLNTSDNQIFFLRGADDADASRGLSVNRGYIVADLLEEYSQEVDNGKLDPDVQIARYKSLHKSSNRYSVKMIEKHGFNFDFRTFNLAMANIWDPEHNYNVALLKVIPEDEWRSFVKENPNKNTKIIRKVDGIIYMRATSANNIFLYPEGSPQREKLIKEMIETINGYDDYKKAEILGFTFPGFIKNDNPIQQIIHMIMDAREEEFSKFKETNAIIKAEYGTDPGNRDAFCSVPAYLTMNNDYEYEIYINDAFIVDNKKRIKLKQPKIPNPVIKEMALDFWKKDLSNLPKEIQNFLEVNIDSRALAIREDFNYDIFPREGINGQCVAIPSQESQGFGLEQRPDILQQIIPKMVFSPYAKQQILAALKTLEPYAPDKQQPHPRKGEMDLYDAFCYAIVKIRMDVRR